jgi:DNA-binding IclR family transcriptional regulator
MQNPDRIPTNLRALLILEILGKSDRPMTATEINADLGLPKQTIHRLCSMLEREGFLARVGASKRFFPARRLRDLGVGLLNTSHLHMARRQILEEVAQSVNETVNFVVPDSAGMNYLDRIEADWAFRIQLPIGTSVPFHCTASGKCFMASLSPRKRQSFVRSLKLDQLTSKTHTEQGPLLDELDEIARQGYSLDSEEFLEGMVAIAVPVLDLRGRFVAALAFHGPTQRLSLETAIARRGVLLNASERLTAALFTDDPTT